MNKFEIHKIGIMFDNGKGRLLEIDSSKLNVLFGSSTTGKSILMRIPALSLGEPFVKEHMIKKNEIRENFKTIFSFSVNGEKVNIYASFVFDGNDYATTYFVDGAENIFVSSIQLSEYLCRKFDYPIFATWDNNGRKTFFSDMLSPLFIDQKHAKTGEAYGSLNLVYKPANRFAAALGFLIASEEDMKLFKEINDNADILNDWLNGKRVNGGKSRLKQAIKSIEVADSDNIMASEFIALDERRSTLRKTLTSMQRKSEAQSYGATVSNGILSKVLQERLVGKVKQDIIDDIKQLFQSYWISVSNSPKRMNIENEVSIELKSVRKDIKKFKLGNPTESEFKLPKNIIEYLTSKIDETTDTLTEEQVKIIEKINDKWLDFYSNMRSKVRDQLEKIKYTFSSGFNYHTAGGTSGLKKTFKFMTNLLEITGGNHNVIWDGVFSEDIGEKNETNKDKLTRKSNVIKSFSEKHITGLLAFVPEDGLKEAIEGKVANINFLDNDVPMETNLNTLELTPDEVQQFKK